MLCSLPFFPNSLAPGFPNYQHALKRRLENNVDPDQLASEKPADLDLHCFRNRKQM